MEIVLKKGEFVQVTEQKIDIDEEMLRLRAWEDALQSDRREEEEREAKMKEIDELPISDEYKEILKRSHLPYSPSGITQEMVDELRDKIETITHGSSR